MEMNTENQDLRDLAKTVADTGIIPEDNTPNSKLDEEEPAIIINPTNNSKINENMNNIPDDAKILMGMNTPAPIKVDAGVLDTPTENLTKLPDEELQLIMEIAPDMPEEERRVKAIELFNTLKKYERELVINNGYSPEEAKVAAKARFKKGIQTVYSEYKEANPSLGVITINKSDKVNDLSLTPSEHEKLEKVNKIKLIVVEDMDLATIKIDRPKEEHKSDYIRSIEGTICRYNIPLPIFGDFIGFKGAQIVQMINAVNYEDARIEEIINKKASLIYEKLINGSIIKKYDESGKIIMSYTEFCNRFPYQDIDMALYGILCASSMEETSTSLTCQGCGHVWEHQYNIKSLLNMETLSELYKERIDTIIKYKTNPDELNKVYKDMLKVRRYKSPMSGNIYDLSYPTVARAINILQRIDQEDSVMTYVSAIALYLSTVLIYDAAKDSYVEVTAEEVDLMLDTVSTLINEDMNLLANQIKDVLIYNATFELHSTCPMCHKTSTIPVGIDNLIFLKAQDSLVEIDN